MGNKVFELLGTTGEKLKRLRIMRNLTQKELGIKSGFSEMTAESRISQYERNLKIPREKALLELAQALEIDDTSLFDANLYDMDRMHQALFDICDGHGLHPVEIDGEVYLKFGGARMDGSSPDPEAYKTFLTNWLIAYQKYVSKENADDKKAEEYMQWRYTYALRHKEK